MTSYLDRQQFAQAVRTRRGHRTLREVLPEIGDTSPATLSRIEHGHMPDLPTFLLLCDWLRMPPQVFIKGGAPPASEPEATAQRLAAIVLGDPKLDPAAANVLTTLIQVAYRDMTRPPAAGVEG